MAALPSTTLRQQVTDSLLNDTNLLEQLGSGIGSVLTANREHPGVKPGALAILTTENFAKALPKDIVSHALNILGKKEAGRKAARVVLGTDNFVRVLPSPIISHALKILADEVTGRAAAATILSIENNLYQLPFEIVGVALGVADESIIKSTAAIYLLKHANRTHTFLQFAALRALATTRDVSSRETLRDHVMELMNDASPTVSLFRLRHDLLFLPLSWVSAHALLLRWFARLYGSDCAARIRWDVFKILNCRLQSVDHFGGAVGGGIASDG